MWTIAGFTILLAYLLGSIPFGYLVGRARGVDVREHGSGNIGATNVLRVVGKPWGILVFAADALKGSLAVEVGRRLAAGSSRTELLMIFAAVACLLGHSFPVWLRFRGGKGVATSAGILLALMPLAILIVFIVWAVTFETTRYVSVASITAAVALPVTIIIMAVMNWRAGPALIVFAVAIAALVIWRHRENVSRLIAGTEPKFQRK